jgi:hypothetical protein
MLTEMINQYLELVNLLFVLVTKGKGNTTRITPTMAISSVERLSVIAELVDGTDEVFEGSYVLASCEHPEGLEEVKKWVGIACGIEQHSLPGPFVGDCHRLLNRDDWTVAAGRSSCGNASRARTNLVHEVLKGFVDVAVTKMHG